MCISISSAFLWKAASVSVIQLFQKRSNCEQFDVLLSRHIKNVFILFGFPGLDVKTDFVSQR